MKKAMITLLLILLNVGVPVEGRVDGVFCDEIMETILDYQEETGAFSESQLEELTGGCLRYEERVEEAEAK
tara:strand:- start:353 stop:565 length:213 start_codon:yes stop_codon:yes gene_type:complete